MLRYSLVIPVLNEQDNVLPLVEELYAVLDPGFELIFVDDGSTDATAERLAAAKERFPGLRLIRHAGRAGKSAALRTGIAAATAPWIVTMDGDGQNDPRDVPRLLAAAEADPAVALVAGLRRKRDDIWRKRVASRIGNGIRRALLRDDCPDTACGLKAIRRDVFLGLPFFDSLHRFFPALVRRHGHAVAMVAVNDRARRAGVSKYTNWGRAVAGLFDLAGVVWLMRRTTLPSAATEI
ncbi:glycosyltransferase family 2 protein [Rhodospirillum centenum]|uniref:Glycosyl transferase, group 2 family protein n=1 Tax=Rhodospirillum centenum (strain ATCC 51521 / SW) TaxID=414684 RepID=B6ITL3_RHOCS|nr:glycosyltransferase family 2 protein [Rhodospirillum centenum]ACI99314.1 glycosyl transferase, group 2 family protein [Rhodospirillum centenum SW]